MSEFLDQTLADLDEIATDSGVTLNWRPRGDRAATPVPLLCTLGEPDSNPSLDRTGGGFRDDIKFRLKIRRSIVPAPGPVPGIGDTFEDENGAIYRATGNATRPGRPQILLDLADANNA